MYKHDSKYTYITEVRTDTLPTGRTYHTVDGSYPSITTILGKTSPNQIWLQKWKDMVGEEEAAKVSKAATDRGTLIHDLAERHFNNESISLAGLDATTSDMVRELIAGVSSGIETIYGQEQVLWSNKYRYAGRTDMVGVWKGNPSIIDFKTSKKSKTESSIRDYFIQCCAYAVAHNEMYKTGIQDVVVVITVENKPAQIFEKSAVPFLYELKKRRIDFDGY